MFTSDRNISEMTNAEINRKIDINDKCMEDINNKMIKMYAEITDDDAEELALELDFTDHLSSIGCEHFVLLALMRHADTPATLGQAYDLISWAQLIDWCQAKNLEMYNELHRRECEKKYANGAY